MVCQSTRYFWQRPVACNARRILFDTQWSLERGSTIDAGVKLREALRAFLFAECQYYGCVPKQKRPPAPRVLARSLKRAGHYSPCAYHWVSELIEVGNKAAHMVMVKPSTIGSAIEVAHTFLDDCPYLVEVKKGGRS